MSTGPSINIRSAAATADPIIRDARREPECRVSGAFPDLQRLYLEMGAVLHLKWWRVGATLATARLCQIPQFSSRCRGSTCRRTPNRNLSIELHTHRGGGRMRDRA